MKVKDSIRRAFVTPIGYIWGSFDYSGQEMCIAAALSQDPVLINTFIQKRDKPYLIKESTKEKYKNPNGDPHLQAAISLKSELNNYPLWELKRLAEGGLDGTNYRKKGKIINFSTLYGKAAIGFAEDFGVSVEEAEEILRKYFVKFNVLKDWLDTTSEFAKYRKAVKTALGRWVYIAESNAKGQQDSGSIKRKGPNSVIQGTGSDMMKIAIRYIRKDKDLSKCIPICVVHDEVNILIPCDYKDIHMHVSEDKGIYYTDFEFSPDIYSIAERISGHMKKAEEDLLSPYIEGTFPAAVEFNLSPWWVH